MLCVVHLFGVTQGQDFIQEDQNHNEILNNHEEVCSKIGVKVTLIPISSEPNNLEETKKHKMRLIHLLRNLFPF